MIAVAIMHCLLALEPDWRCEVGAATVEVYAIQREEPVEGSPYDWGACVMKDGDLYRMWWTRQSPRSTDTIRYEGTDQDGKPFAFDYTIEGDRIYYAESRDGYTWRLNGTGREVSVDEYDADSPYPVEVLRAADSRWEKKQIADPSVVKVDGTFYMYYEGAGEFRPRPGETPIEYNNAVFLASSLDGKHWTKWPSNEDPQPVVAPRAENLAPENRRYGCGQPSVFYRDGRFVLHYVDATGWPDVMVRIESPDPTFRTEVTRIQGLRDDLGSLKPVPESIVSKFAMTDLGLIGASVFLVRPVYGTDRVALLRSETGVFGCDDRTNDPALAPRQIPLHDPRGVEFPARLYPRFLRGPHGEIVGGETHMTLFYASGRQGPGWTAYTWDIHRADLSFPAPLTP
ncbi:MAG: hypothetical protein QG656_450 [Candidatus Hydrogenedentes bacterium]|nr:hypothetical protein [Candidatus Hydrogenedentota bacterium]